MWRTSTIAAVYQAIATSMGRKKSRWRLWVTGIPGRRKEGRAEGDQSAGGLGRGPELRAPVSIPDTLLVRVISVGTFETRTPALDGLFRSSRISLIEDVSVRSAIAAWERAVRNASELDLRARRLTDEQLVPALWDRGNVGHILRSEVAGIRAPLDDLEPLLRGLRVDPTASTWIAPDVQLGAAMSQRFQAAARASGALGAFLVSTDALLEVISATQGR